MNKTKTHSIRELSKSKLKNVLGAWDLFSIGYGDLSSSIYYALGVTALYALGATPIALLIAGIVFICTSLTYAEMSSTFPDSGGSASFSRVAFNDLISFIAGWGLLLDYLVTIAISSFAIPPYLKYLIQAFIPSFTLTLSWHIGITLSLILGIFFINLVGVKHSSTMNKILMFFTVFTQIGIILLGMIFLFNPKEFLFHLRIGVPGVDWSPSFKEFFQGAAMAMVAYTGIESIAQLGSEAKNPRRALPKAMKWNVILLLFLYLGISGVALSAVSPRELGTTYINDPMTGIVKGLPFSWFLTPWVSLLAICILFMASNAGLLGISRLSFKMGEYYQMPRVFFRSHKRFKTPYLSLGFFTLMAILVILASRGKMLFLADLYNFGAMIAFFSAHLSLLVLRIKKPSLARPFRIPLNLKFKKYALPLPALFGGVMTFSIFILIVITKPEGRLLGFSWMFLGVLFFSLYRQKKKLSPLTNIHIEKIKVPNFSHLKFKKIFVATRGGESTETVQIASQLAKDHQAELLAAYIIEIPFSLPLDVPLSKATLLETTKALKRAEAIATEYEVPMQSFQVRARYVAEGILHLLESIKPDLLVIGLPKKTAFESGIGGITEKILKHSSCRVWICRGK